MIARLGRRWREALPSGRRSSVAGTVPALVVLGLLFGGALTGTVLGTLDPPGDATGADVWSTALGDERLVESLLFTLAIVVATTVISAALALALATWIRSTPAVARFRQRLVGVPVLVPPLVLGTVAVLWLAPAGLADRLVGGALPDLVRDRFGIGIVLVSTWKEAPFLTLLALTAWDEQVVRREEAAATLGAGVWQRRRHVVWPAVRTPLAIGSLVASSFVLGSFEIPLVVGPTSPPMLSVLALQQTRVGSLTGTAVASATLLVTALLALVPALVAARLVRRADA